MNIKINELMQSKAMEIAGDFENVRIESGECDSTMTVYIDGVVNIKSKPPYYHIILRDLRGVVVLNPSDYQSIAIY